MLYNKAPVLDAPPADDIRREHFHCDPDGDVAKCGKRHKRKKTGDTIKACAAGKLFGFIWNRANEPDNATSFHAAEVLARPCRLFCKSAYCPRCGEWVRKADVARIALALADGKPWLVVWLTSRADGRSPDYARFIRLLRSFAGDTLRYVSVVERGADGRRHFNLCVSWPKLSDADTLTRARLQIPRLALEAGFGQRCASSQLRDPWAWASYVLKTDQRPATLNERCIRSSRSLLLPRNKLLVSSRREQVDNAPRFMLAPFIDKANVPQAIRFARLDALCKTMPKKIEVSEEEAVFLTTEEAVIAHVRAHARIRSTPSDYLSVLEEQVDRLKGVTVKRYTANPTPRTPMLTNRPRRLAPRSFDIASDAINKIETAPGVMDSDGVVIAAHIDARFGGWGYTVWADLRELIAQIAAIGTLTAFAARLPADYAYRTALEQGRYTPQLYGGSLEPLYKAVAGLNATLGELSAVGIPDSLRVIEGELIALARTLPLLGSRIEALRDGQDAEARSIDIED